MNEISSIDNKNNVYTKMNSENEGNEIHHNNQLNTSQDIFN